MVIAVVGLGLIGGSFCKALKQYTNHTVLGVEVDKMTRRNALSSGAVDKIIEPHELDKADLSIICLYPEQTIDFILDNAHHFAPKSIVIDVCGVKESIQNAVHPPLQEKDVIFIGAHPMAGREFSGFEYATADLFANASFVMTPHEDTPIHAVFVVSMLAEQLKFSKVVKSTPEEHDKIIAFTSQLAHIVSNAYVKSPSLELQKGFSAGSFGDLTRVARLNEDMWSSLFTLNKDALLFELDTIINNLGEYKHALENNDADTLRKLLKDGRILKEKSLIE